VNSIPAQHVNSITAIAMPRTSLENINKLVLSSRTAKSTVRSATYMSYTLSRTNKLYNSSKQALVPGMLTLIGYQAYLMFPIYPVVIALDKPFLLNSLT
jgi:hypothetical protein